jgi:glycosyltransferase involved in cell wall biosynthesis
MRIISRPSGQDTVDNQFKTGATAMTTILFTTAYNAAATLNSTVESVLAQTHRDWRYYLVDNGSQDETGALIRKWARQDPRILPRANRVNNRWEPGNGWTDLFRRAPGDYFCVLDADDTYHPDFLTEALGFMQRHSLDLALCGYEYVDPATGEILQRRVPGRDYWLEGETFGAYFPYYFPLARAVWGKVYAMPLLRRANLDMFCGSPVYADTLFVLETLLQARRAGVLAKGLCRYAYSETSGGRRFYPERVGADRALFRSMGEFLQKKCGRIQPANQKFLYQIYAGNLRATLTWLLRGELPLAEQARYAGEILRNGDVEKVTAWVPTFFDEVAALVAKAARAGGFLEALAILAATGPSRLAAVCLQNGWGQRETAGLCRRLQGLLPGQRDLGALAQVLGQGGGFGW